MDLIKNQKSNERTKGLPNKSFSSHKYPKLLENTILRPKRTKKDQ